MYVKLFASLYQGTLRGCSDEILVFTNLLAHADIHGIVDKHWRAISEETGLSRERVEAAITNLEAPDPESRSPEQEGRRIVKMDEHRAWGWKIVNYGKYRSIRNEDDRREQNRIAQEKWRNKNKQSKPRKPESAQAEAYAEEVNPSADKSALSAFDQFWKAYPKKVGKGAAEKAWLKARINGSLQTILEAVERQSASDQWMKDNGQFIPNPATWIGQKRWEDGIGVEIDSAPKIRLCCECHKNPVSVNTRGGVCHVCL